MNDHPRNEDPIRSALSPLRSCPWEAAGHRHELERRLMHAVEQERPRRGPSRLVIAAAVLALAGVAAGASGLARDWWEKFTYTFTDNQDGTFNLTVTDEDGNVDLDEDFADGTEIMHADDGSYIAVEPDPGLEAEADAVLKELPADGQD